MQGSRGCTLTNRQRENIKSSGVRLRETEQELEGMKDMDDSGIYRFLECTEIVRGMEKNTKMKTGRLKSMRRKTQETKKVRERRNRGMNREKKTSEVHGELSAFSEFRIHMVRILNICSDRDLLLSTLTQKSTQDCHVSLSDSPLHPPNNSTITLAK